MCEEARRVLDSPNAGGSSELSEAFSMQILHDHFGAHTIQTEMEIKYWSDHWKRCDFVTKVRNEFVAVSVTRVATPPMNRKKLGHSPKIVFNREMAIHLLDKKLYGLVVARAGFMDEGYYRSWLHILCQTDEEVDILRSAYDELTPELQSDIEVIVTQVTGDDAKYLFSNQH